MKFKLGFISQNESIIDNLKFARENGFNCLEIIKPDFIHSGKINYTSLWMLKKIKEMANKNNIYLSYHLPYSFKINSSTKITPDIIKIIKNEITVARTIGAKIITIHGSDRVYSRPLNSNLLQLIDNLREIVKIGNKYNINICLENSSKGLIRKPKEFLYVLNSVKNLKATFDVGHAYLAKTDLKRYVTRLKEFILDVHLHDSDDERDHKAIGLGKINFYELIKVFKRINYGGPFILEIFSYKDILKSKEKIVKIWNST